MFDIVEKWESKGFRFCLYPQKDGSNWYWTAGVYIGDERKAEWVDCNNGLPRAAYPSYKEAFKALVDYCENYKTRKRK